MRARFRPIGPHQTNPISCAGWLEQDPCQLASSLDSIPWAAKVTGYRPDPSVLADVQNAYYAAVQNLARLPYQAIIAVTFVVLVYVLLLGRKAKGSGEGAA